MTKEKITYIDRLEAIKQIAIEAHKGQKRWNGEDYINHPIRVADRFEREPLKIIAWLHDVLEDTKLTKADLVSQGIPKELCETIDLLTRKKDQSYLDYILRIKDDAFAKVVKIVDLKDNLWDIKDGSLKDKYLLALYILRQE
jgi:(p)ppGpp synthase/HD superfamily hydrolase